MLPKKNRADKRVVEKIFKEGKFLNSSSLAFKFTLTNNSAAPRISFIVPKTTSKKAVNRNKLRRRGYNILGKYVNQLPFGLAGVFIFKKYQDDILVLEDEIKTIFSEIN